MPSKIPPAPPPPPPPSLSSSNSSAPKTKRSSGPPVFPKRAVSSNIPGTAPAPVPPPKPRSTIMTQSSKQNYPNYPSKNQISGSLTRRTISTPVGSLTRRPNDMVMLTPQLPMLPTLPRSEYQQSISGEGLPPSLQRRSVRNTVDENTFVSPTAAATQAPPPPPPPGPDINLLRNHNFQSELNAALNTQFKTTTRTSDQRTPSPTKSLTSASAQASPTGGWQSGYQENAQAKKAVPLPQFDSGVALSVSSDEFVDIVEEEEPPVESQKTQRKSLIAYRRPSLEEGDDIKEVHIVDFLEGKRQLKLGNIEFKVTNAITMSDFGFVLEAEALSAVSSSKKQPKNGKPVFIKCIDRKSPAYTQLGRLINPMHTELSLLKQGAKHLPEYIEHFCDEDYMYIVTKRHGIKKTGWNPFEEKYHEVQWIFYFNQAA